MTLAREIGSSELDADVVLALLGEKVVMLTVFEGAMGGLLVLEMEVNEALKELPILKNDEEVAFEEIMRFELSRGGCMGEYG